jgi:outer membrane protein assembly factor BamD (BamD/ComL family)
MNNQGSSTGGYMKASFCFTFFILSIFVIVSCSRTGEKEYYVKATESMEQGNYEEAAKFFAKILEDYPNGENASKALFMIGFINANYLKDYDKAKAYYTEFIEKYPEHELARSAAYEINHLGQDIYDLPFLHGEQTDAEDVKDKQFNSNKSQ